MRCRRVAHRLEFGTELQVRSTDFAEQHAPRAGVRCSISCREAYGRAAWVLGEASSEHPGCSK
eukprot:7299642-Alexandrium_andersonii.AAC.1